MVGDKRLIVISEGAYPIGGAATNRHLAYLGGLVELGVEVDLLVIYPSKNQPRESAAPIGVENGVRYKYVLKSTNYERKKYKRLFGRARGIITAMLLTFNYVRKHKKKQTVLLILTTSFLDTLPFIIVTKLFNIKTFHERTEHPFVNIPNSKLSKLLTFGYLKFLIPTYSGLFVISGYLKQYFSKYTKKKIEVINMIVQPERFHLLKKTKEKYIVYTGSMYTKKDGVTDLLEAFDIVAEKYNDYKLVLVGDNSDKERFKYISDKIESLKWGKNVICTGFVPKNGIPYYLINADVLVLARPDSLQAKAGFPTKLGEYLATGNPVVVTKVGEIPNFLVHKKNSFLAEPGNIVDFAEKLLEAIEDKSLSREIGLKGRELCYTEFYYKTQAKKLIKFFYGPC